MKTFWKAVCMSWKCWNGHGHNIVGSGKMGIAWIVIALFSMMGWWPFSFATAPPGPWPIAVTLRIFMACVLLMPTVFFFWQAVSIWFWLRLPYPEEIWPVDRVEARTLEVWATGEIVWGVDSLFACKTERKDTETGFQEANKALRGFERSGCVVKESQEMLAFREERKKLFQAVAQQKLQLDKAVKSERYGLKRLKRRERVFIAFNIPTGPSVDQRIAQRTKPIEAPPETAAPASAQPA